MDGLPVMADFEVMGGIVGFLEFKAWLEVIGFEFIPEQAGELVPEPFIDPADGLGEFPVHAGVVRESGRNEGGRVRAGAGALKAVGSGFGIELGDSGVDEGWRIIFTDTPGGFCAFDAGNEEVRCGGVGGPFAVSGLVFEMGQIVLGGWFLDF